MADRCTLIFRANMFYFSSKGLLLGIILLNFGLNSQKVIKTAHFTIFMPGLDLYIQITMNNENEGRLR